MVHPALSIECFDTLEYDKDLFYLHNYLNWY